MEMIVLIDWMDVTPLAMTAGGPTGCDRRAREIIDEFHASYRPASAANSLPYAA